MQYYKAEMEGCTIVIPAPEVPLPAKGKSSVQHQHKFMYIKAAMLRSLEFLISTAKDFSSLLYYLEQC